MKEIAEAIKVIKENGYKIIKEDVYTSNFQLNKRIKEYLENDKFVIVLLIGMYGRQVDFEKRGRRTVLRNFKGFNQTDAAYLSPLAEKVQNGQVLTPREIAFVKSCLRKYKNTQWSEVLKELGYVREERKPGRKIELFFDELEFAPIDDDEIETIVPNSEEDYIAKALSLAQEDGGMLDDEELSRAKQIAADLYHQGLIAPQDAADRINEEL